MKIEDLQKPWLINPQVGQSVVMVGSEVVTLKTIRKVMAKTILISDGNKFTIEGNRITPHSSLGITNDPAAVTEMQSKIDQRTNLYEQKKKADREREARPEYQLASRLCGLEHSATSVCDAWMALGADKLSQIISWLNESGQKV